MKSRGEVMGVGAPLGGAFVKSQLAAGVRLPQGGKAFISVRDADKHAAVQVALDLVELGFSLLATRGTAAILKSHGIAVTQVNKVAEGRPHIVDMIKNGEVNFIVNTVEATRTAASDSRALRAPALAGRRMKTPRARRAPGLLRGELQRLKSVERPANSQAIAEARSHGDLSENAEYEAARNHQGMIEARIRDI